ncbi:MAG: hypothetical protein U0U69_07555 [Acidimicrobiia bacterium]
MTRNKLTITSIAAVTALALVVGGCSQRYSAERDGKKLGEAVCDLRKATTKEDAQKALDDIDNQLDDLGNKHALFTAEDRRDVQNNLADLHEHAIQGNTALMQQDLVVLERSIKNIANDSNEVSRAAWEGALEGMADCTQ